MTTIEIELPNDECIDYEQMYEQLQNSDKVEGLDATLKQNLQFDLGDYILDAYQRVNQQH